MSNFYIHPIAEYRSDDPTWIMWRVNLNNKDYLMAYSQDRLKEVYFVGERIPNYFMSCRADNLYHISHYYVDNKTNEVRRYERGVHNRTYYDTRHGVMWCDTHKYIQKVFTDENPDVTRIWKDLEKFLVDFQKSGIQIEKPYYVK